MKIADAMSFITQAESEQLLKENGWVHALARSLVGQADLADDLTQELWLKALQHPPKFDSANQSVRAWLATVLRNLIRQKRRSDDRRSDREQRESSSESLPSTLELVERVSIQRDVAQAVMDLEEPYRTAIALRYFEELQPREIASRTGTPVSTVKTQLVRGLEKLRARLDESHNGDRSSWLMALIPLSGRSADVTAATSTIGVYLVSSKVLMIAVATLLASGVVAFFALPGDSTEAASATKNTPSITDPLGHSLQQSPEAVALGVAPEEERVAIADTVTQSSAKPVVAIPDVEDLRILRGRVLDSEGRPLAAVELSLTHRSNVQEEGAKTVGRSGPDGRFEFEVESRIASVVSNDDRYATILAGSASVSGSQVESIVLLGERMDLSGRVVDELGVRLGNASVSYVLPDNFRSRFAEVLDYSQSIGWKTESAETGAYSLSDIPIVRGGMFRVALREFEVSIQEAPQFSTNALDVVLVRPGEKEDTLRGRVVDPMGVPSADVEVSFGLVTFVTDESGNFRFTIDDEESLNARQRITPQQLIAVKRGYQPGVYRLSVSNGDVDPQGFVVLQLGGEPLTIEGRVLDGDGEPLEDMYVWISNPTTIGVAKDGRRPGTLETALAGRKDEGWLFEETDKNGRFRIEGLTAREYELEAMDPTTLLRAESLTVEAGASGVELRFQEDAYFEVVSGRLLTWTGKPLAGLEVTTMCDAYRSRFQGQVIGTRHMTATSATSDDKGYFELEQVPRSLVYLRIDGEESIPLEFGRGVEGGILELTDGKTEDIEIVVSLRCHFRVELGADSAAEEIGILDANGNELVIDSFEGNGRMSHERMPIAEGNSSVLVVPDTAQVLVIYSEGEEISRRAISLAPGEVSVID